MMAVYGLIVFVQGDDYAEAEREADEATARVVSKDDPYWPGMYRGSAEWTRALFEHLMQWEDGEGREQSESAGHGTDDDLAYFTNAGRRYGRKD